MTVEERIRSDIEARIHSGAWRPGDRIPFEHELVIAYGCSRATVGKALATLARAGLIERRRKAGTFVAHPQLHSAVLAVPDLAEVVAARGETYGWRRIERARCAQGPDFPEEALLVRGVHLAGGAPFALEHRLIALAAVPEAADEAFTNVSPGSWLLKRIPWTAARHRIAAVEANAAEAKALALRRRAACLELVRTTWRGEGSVTRVRQLFPGDRFDLVADFKPGA